MGDECPGSGKCHGCMKWCDRCGDVAHVCDTRLRGERCAEHPVPLTWQVLRAAREATERKIRVARAEMRAGEEELLQVVDLENARRAYDRQMAEEERRAFEVPPA